MEKSIEAVRALLEEMASNTYYRSSERATPRRAGGKHDVDAITLLANRVDAFAQRLVRIGTFSTPGSSTVPARIYTAYKTCGVPRHTSA